MLADLYRRHLAKAATARDGGDGAQASETARRADAGEEEYGVRLGRFSDRQARMTADGIRDGLGEVGGDYGDSSSATRREQRHRRAHFLASLAYRGETAAQTACLFAPTRLQAMRNMQSAYGGSYGSVIERINAIYTSLQ